ncbi:YcaO-like family protein [Streptomyces sp. NPDC005574]|uniref:YcaO-like family protein n=1 Tax=Streptomyces sp. NPDC005574 TaxID=3156891 RepID=UPI0033A93DD5
MSAEEYARWSTPAPVNRCCHRPPTAPIRWVARLVADPAASGVCARRGGLDGLRAPQRPAERIGHQISTGFADHGDLRTAVTHALCECVERDVISTVWLRRLPLPQLDISPRPSLVRRIGRCWGTAAKRVAAHVTVTSFMAERASTIPLTRSSPRPSSRAASATSGIEVPAASPNPPACLLQSAERLDTEGS